MRERCTSPSQLMECMHVVIGPSTGFNWMLCLHVIHLSALNTAGRVKLNNWQVRDVVDMHCTLGLWISFRKLINYFSKVRCGLEMHKLWGDLSEATLRHWLRWELLIWVVIAEEADMTRGSWDCHLFRADTQDGCTFLTRTIQGAVNKRAFNCKLAVTLCRSCRLQVMVRPR